MQAGGISGQLVPGDVLTGMEMGSSAPEAAVPSGICTAGAGIPHGALLPPPDTQPAKTLPELEFVALNTFPGTRQIFQAGLVPSCPFSATQREQPPDPTFLLQARAPGFAALLPSPAGWKILGSLSAVGGITLLQCQGAGTSSEVSLNPFVGLFLCSWCLSCHLWQCGLCPGKGHEGKELLPGASGAAFLNFTGDLGHFVPLL